MELYDALKKYVMSDAYPFHMPGHKRNSGEPLAACAVDITEIDGFDNLHHAEGILRDIQKKAAELYGAEDTYYLVNGSTAGILAAISAGVRRGGKLLMARNSHKAAYHAAELRGLRVEYLYPRREGLPGGAVRPNDMPSGAIQPDDMPGGAIRPDDMPDGAVRPDDVPGGTIQPDDVRAALERDSEIEAVFITSPTYEGVVSDVARIAEVAHSFGIPLIVDEAHGAHFGFHPDFPQSSVKLGADLVVHSLHKTLPSLTQTALLHRSGLLVSNSRVQKFLDIFQTSSPSYVLMASMDACIDLLRERGNALFEIFAAKLKTFYSQAERLRHIHFLGNDKRDMSKLVFRAEGRSGKWVADTLRKRFHLEMEMAAADYVIALTSVADTQEGFDRLLAALHILDEELEQSAALGTDMRQKGYVISPDAGVEPVGSEEKETERSQEKPVYTIAEAGDLPHRRIALAEAAEQISAEYIYLYPPGIPLVVPGERIRRETLAKLQSWRLEGFLLQGLSDYTMETVEIV